MENSYIPYLGINDDDEQLVCHHQSGTSQNRDDLIFSHTRSYNLLLSFDNSDVERVPNCTIQQPCRKQEYGHDDSAKQFGSRRNPKSLDHVMAERKRRHELAEKFIALSAVVPGLKKMNKASVLGGAINYLKQLQQQIKELEEKGNNKKKSKEKPYTCGHNNCHNNDDGNDDDMFPEVEARVLEREILIRIQCKKQNEIMLKIASLLENSHFTITHSSVLPLRNSCTLSITIITQMRDEYGMTVNDLVKSLKREISSNYVRVHAS